MKIGLKTRLILSYTLLSMLLVVSLLFISNLLLEKQFQNYLQEKQEVKNQEYVDAVKRELENNKPLSEENLLALGQKALNEGIILMVTDSSGDEAFCMSCYDNLRCETMLNAMELTMKNKYPNFEGEYTEKKYEVNYKGEIFGTVTLGYYGPYYLMDADIKFMDVLLELYITAAIIFFLIAIVVGYFMAIRISNPIKEVTLKTSLIERGDFSCRIQLPSNTTEIQELINNVNALATTLETQQSLKKRMAADYAHEFRTPLAAIQSNLEGIMDGIFQPTEDRLESIRSEILRLSRMVSEIDKIFELEREELTSLVKEPFDLFDLFKKTISTFEAEMLEKSISLKIRGEFCEIWGDQDKLRSAIVNLISNAVKYTDPGGEIEITVKENQDTVTITFVDSGVGIAPEDLPNIFDHLYRTDLSRARNTGGNGIGLSVVKAVVEAHCGTISVDSEMGKGSTFTINLCKKA